jgi:hypothetical protein
MFEQVPWWVWLAIYVATVVIVTILYKRSYVKKEQIEKAKSVIAQAIPYVPDPQAKETLTLILKYLQYLTGEISEKEWLEFKKALAVKYNL